MGPKMLPSPASGLGRPNASMVPWPKRGVPPGGLRCNFRQSLRGGVPPQVATTLLPDRALERITNAVLLGEYWGKEQRPMR